MEKQSKIFVAGHLGMVGSAIWKTLTGKGFHKLVGRSVEELDLRDQEATARFFEQEKPEYVFLAAARVGGIQANNTFRANFIYDNLMIQNNVIHQSYVHGVKKLLFLGSTCIYPRDCPQPIKEEYLLTGPLEYTNEPYAVAKIAGIKMCESYNLQYGTDYLAVMPTNLYGPNDNFDPATGHVLPALMRKMHLAKCVEQEDWDAIRGDLDRRPLGGVNGRASKDSIMRALIKAGIRLLPHDRVGVKVWGTGKPLREFLWSEDMAEACVFVMEQVSYHKLLTEPKAGTDAAPGRSPNAHLNIGTGREISIHDLAVLIKDTVGFGGPLLFDDSQPDGSPRKLTDPGRLQQLGWQHRVELEDGVKRLYEWY